MMLDFALLIEDKYIETFIRWESRTLRAAVFSEPDKPLLIKDVEKPSIGPDEMLLQVSYCGVCGTDIHASREGPFKAPKGTVFGHEFVGRIVEIGIDLKNSNFSIGDRVTSLPFIGSKTIGLGAITGAYSQFVKVGHDLVVKIPDQMTDIEAVLVEPLAVGLHATKMAGQISEKNILIIGAGPIGLACAIWCNFFGARSVVISERSPTRIEKAKELGFHDVIDPSTNTVEAFMIATGGEPEIQFDCVGAPGIMQECIERAPKKGLVMGIGVCDQPDTITPLIAFSKELRIQWAVAYEKADFEFTIGMIKSKRINATKMVTNIISLEELPNIFQQLQNPSEQCKVLIDLSKNSSQ